MSDPRGTHRGSKTAAVVMLLVMIQVLVVAILGLGAISRDRTEAQRSARQQADSDALGALDETLREAERELKAVLHDVASIRGYADFRSLRDGFHDHAAVIETVYRIAPASGDIYWLDGRHLIRESAESRRLRVQEDNEQRAQSMEDTLAIQTTAASKLRYMTQLIREFPYRLSVDVGNPTAPAVAEKLLELALAEAENKATQAAYDDLEAALLDVYELYCLLSDWGGYKDWDRPTVEALADFVRGAATGLSQYPSIRRHLEAYAEARRLLETYGVALRAAIDSVSSDAPRERFHYVAPYLFAVAPLHDGTAGASAMGLVVAPIRLNAVEELILGAAEATRFRRLGIRLELVGEDEPSTTEALEVVSLRDWGIPVRARLLRVEEPILPAGGPSEFFYWGIIILAAAGLGMGAWVLTRLYTREVRLARLKADFVSNLSHELKTPLTSISLFTEMLQDGQLGEAEEQKEGLAVLAQESERLQRIVARMLDVAKREARGIPYELAPGDLNVPVEAAVQRFRRIVADEGLDLRLELHPGPLPMMLDLAALDDAVTNLISNAWKYRRGEEAHIVVRTTRVGRHAEVVVQDDGIGIPKRERRRVFEMFYRAEAYLTRSVAGTGLGLSLVRTIVRAHKGRIKCEAAESEVGTVFRMSFPLLGRIENPSAARHPVTPAAQTEATS